MGSDEATGPEWAELVASAAPSLWAAAMARSQVRPDEAVERPEAEDREQKTARLLEEHRAYAHTAARATG